MKILTKLLCTVVFAGATLPCLAKETAQEEPNALVRAAGHGVATILYDSTALLVSALTLIVPIVAITGKRDPMLDQHLTLGNLEPIYATMTPGEYLATGLLNGAVLAVTLWGRYKLPEWTDMYLFGKHSERSRTHKAISFLGRSFIGWPAAVIDSLAESEIQKRKKQ